MAKLGEKRITLPGGSVVTVPIHSPGDVEYPVRRIAAPNGSVGCLPVYPVSQYGDQVAYPGRRLYHPTYGVMAYHDSAQVQQIFDDFNDGTAGNTVGSPWTYTSGNQTYETAAAYEGPLGLRCNSGACDSFGSTAPYYPQWGDKVEHYWRSTTGDTYMNTYLFATKNSNQVITNGYRFGHYVQNNYVYLERIKSGSGTNLYSNLSTTQNQDVWYHDEMHFLDQASEKIRWVIRNASTGSLVHDITVTPSTPNAVAANTGVRISIDSTKTGNYDYVNVVPGGATA